MSPKELRKRRKKISMIFQQFNLFGARTVYENVAFPLRKSKLTKAEKKEKVQSLLKLVELEGKVFDIFANPKSAVTKEIVDNTTNLSKIHELIENGSDVASIKPGQVILKSSYTERDVSEALVSQISRKFNLDVNIIFGSVELIGSNPIGGLVSIIHGESQKIDEAIEYLKDKNVGVEVILDARVS